MALSFMRLTRTALVPTFGRLLALRMFLSSGTFFRFSSSVTERVNRREQAGAGAVAVRAALTALSLNKDN